MMRRLGAALVGEGGARAVVLPWPPLSGRAAVPWLHMGSLFVLLSFVGSAGMVVLDGLAVGASLSRLPAVLYWWVPSVLGIVVAATPLEEQTGTRITLLVLGGIAVLVALDLVGAFIPSFVPLQAVQANGQVSRAFAAGTTIRPESWVVTLWTWATGGLSGVADLSSSYAVGHPRIRVVEALTKLSVLPLALGTVGVLVALRRWIHANVIFRKQSNDLVSGAVLGWMIGPSLTVMLLGLTQRAQTDEMFENASPLGICLPSVLFAVIGTVLLVYGRRRTR